MKTLTKRFYYVSHAHDTIIINAHIHADGALPILWNNKGLFCIISRQKVQNIIDIMKDQGNLPILNTKRVDTFWWEDGELITARAAAMLLS